MADLSHNIELTEGQAQNLAEAEASIRHLESIVDKQNQQLALLQAIIDRAFQYIDHFVFHTVQGKPAPLGEDNLVELTAMKNGEAPAITPLGRAKALKAELLELCKDPDVLRFISDYFHDQEWETTYSDLGDPLLTPEYNEPQIITGLLNLGAATFTRRPAPEDADTENDIEEWAPAAQEGDD